MSTIVLSSDRDLSEVVKDFLALAEATRKTHRSELISALASDDSERIDRAVSSMTEDANHLLDFLGTIEGYEVTCEFTYSADVEIDDNFKISIFITRDARVESELHA